MQPITFNRTVDFPDVFSVPFLGLGFQYLKCIKTSPVKKNTFKRSFLYPDLENKRLLVWFCSQPITTSNLMPTTVVYLSWQFSVPRFHQKKGH